MLTMRRRRLRQHRRQRVLAAEERAGEVDVHRRRPPRSVELGDAFGERRVGAVARGVVDQESSRRRLDRRVDRALHLPGVGDVARDGARAAARRRDRRAPSRRAARDAGPAATTAAPSRARRSAMARPMPEPAPVTSATLPANRSVHASASQRSGTSIEAVQGACSCRAASASPRPRGTPRKSARDGHAAVRPIGAGVRIVGRPHEMIEVEAMAQLDADGVDHERRPASCGGRRGSASSAALAAVSVNQR